MAWLIRLLRWEPRSPGTLVLHRLACGAVLLLFFVFVFHDLQFGLVSAGVFICINIPRGLLNLRRDRVARVPERPSPASADG